MNKLESQTKEIRIAAESIDKAIYGADFKKFTVAGMQATADTIDFVGACMEGMEASAKRYEWIISISEARIDKAEREMQEQRHIIRSLQIFIVGLAAALILSNLMHIAWHKEMEAQIQAMQESSTNSIAYNQPGGGGDAIRDSQLHRADRRPDNLPG